MLLSFRDEIQRSEFSESWCSSAILAEFSVKESCPATEQFLHRVTQNVRILVENDLTHKMLTSRGLALWIGSSDLWCAVVDRSRRIHLSSMQIAEASYSHRFTGKISWSSLFASFFALASADSKTRAIVCWLLMYLVENDLLVPAHTLIEVPPLLKWVLIRRHVRDNNKCVGFCLCLFT